MAGLAQCVRDAVLVRETLACPPHTSLRRLFHDEADGVEGLVIDRYDGVARIDIKSGPLSRDAQAIAKVLVDTAAGLTGVCMIERPKGGGEKAQLTKLWGDVPAQIVVHEDATALVVRLMKHNAPLSGAFVDLREGRRLARLAAAGRPALNLFAHAGAFGAAMARGGASRVDHVDAARSCAPWAALNLAVNGINPRQHRFVVDDAFKFLRRAAKRGPHYGVIAADPPTTAARPGGRFVVSEALVPLATDACTALAPGGVLLLSTNDRRISVDDVMQAANEGARMAGRDVERCVAIPTPADLMPHGVVVGDIPLRGVSLRVL